MRHLFIVVVMGVLLGVCESATANPASVVVSNAAIEWNEPIPIYPALRLWMIAYDNVTPGCLANLIRYYNGRIDNTKITMMVESILSSAIRHDLDPLLVASVIAAESSFYPEATSPCGAEGLMQLTKPVQPWLGVNDPFDINQNIEGGCRYLTYLKGRFSTDELVLAAYNAGPTRVARLGRVPQIQETLRYIKRVVALYDKLSSDVDGAVTSTFTPDPIDPFVLV